MNPSLKVGFNYTMRIKGGLRQDQHGLSFESAPELARLLMRLVSSKSEVVGEEYSENEVKKLAELGFLVKEDEAPQRILPICTFETQHLDEIKWADFLSRLPKDLSGYAWSPTAWVQETQELPPELSRFGLKEQALGFKTPILWVESQGSGIANPYALDFKLLPILKGLARGEINPSTIERRLQGALLLSDALVLKDGMNNLSGKIEVARTEYEKTGAALIRGILNPFRIAAMRDYYKRMLREGYFYLDVTQVKEKRSSIYNDVVAALFHGMFANVISSIVGEKAIPSYNYVTSYHPGAVLAKHRDRAACQWNISLMLGSDPEFGVGEGWPIYLQLPDGTREVDLKPGDALLYRGTDVPHWRKQLSERHYVHLLLFHFVQSDHQGFVYPD